MTPSPLDPREARRPLLGGGERLQQPVDPGGGGGPKFHPRTLEQAREVLTPQLTHLREVVAQTDPQLRGERVVFEATVLPNYLANSYFPGELFRAADLVPVGTRGALGTRQTRTKVEENQPTKTYLLAGDERSLTKLASLLAADEPPQGATVAAHAALKQFEVVRLPSENDVLRVPPNHDAEELMTWEAVLHPAVAASGDMTADEYRSVMEKWHNWVTALGGEIADDFTRVVKGMTFVPVRLPASAGAAAARFNPLRALRPMPRVRPIPSTPLRVTASSLPVPPAPAGGRPQSDVRIAAFDGGLDDSLPHIAPFASAIDVTPEPPDPDSVAHGTMVTSALLYGPLEPGQELSVPEVGVDHFRVVPPPANGSWDVDLYWILDRIEELVLARDYPIVNLSLGPAFAVEDDDEPHAWTARLDELTQQRGTLFVSAAGNNGNEDSAAGLDRIQVPADAVNSIGVGACDTRTGAPWTRAPYSARGPGRPGARVQPIGLAFGGVVNQPFTGLAPGGVVGQACGTSFAAPVASHGLASLSALLGAGTATPSVLRAFAAHFAEAAGDLVSPEDGGFGRIAERYDEFFDCPVNEVTVLYRSSIERDQAVSLELPVPADIVQKGNISLRWTLAFTAPTDPSDAVDYTQAGLEASLRPHAHRFSYKDPDTGKYRTLNLVEDADEILALIRAGSAPPALPVTTTSSRFKNEALKRDEGKWETTLRYARSMRAKSLFNPHITVNYLARDGGALSAAVPLEFAMLATISAPRGIPLYDEVRNRYGVLTPLATRLPLRLRP